ncbi:cytochrome-c peroxidase [Pseudidiomarina taiwanensis]|uniref:Cytochrome-c peroxidase n=1 Tax=Pseudidiomarina taiwanensis TaxID=337250 RepID=A0A432ZKF3_9GAMM|nr:cytochrome c peroxidase [Pseudidiomarina taiwanensis]RUO78374.1 cytochrome-c peroxidase [Pseudidiomarina taiwanensis]
MRGNNRLLQLFGQTLILSSPLIALLGLVLVAVLVAPMAHAAKKPEGAAPFLESLYTRLAEVPGLAQGGGAAPSQNKGLPPLLWFEELVGEELWQAYLKPQPQWPTMHPGASEDLAPLPAPPAQPPKLVALGAQLFHDPILSRDNTVSCASCHIAEHAFADTRRNSPGVDGRIGKRNSPTLLDAHLWQSFFWDSRSPTLIDQAAHPLHDPLEMDLDPHEAARRASAKYQQDLSWDEIAIALASFQMSLSAYNDPNNRLDAFLHAVAAKDYTTARQTLTDQELHGLHLYRTKAGCIQCHGGALLSDQRHHNMGLHYYGRRFEDLGLFEITQKVEDMGKFRTPSLRHLHKTKPWMHNGLFTQLDGIVRMYSMGGPRPKRPQNLPLMLPYPQTSELLNRFEINPDERQALVAFLELL